MELESQVFHVAGGCVERGGVADGVLEDNGDTAAEFVSSALPGNLVAGKDG